MNQIQKIIVSIVASVVIIYLSYAAISWEFDDTFALIMGIVLAGIFNAIFWRSKHDPTE